MVAHLLRLKVALLRNGLRRSPWQLVGLAFGALYGASFLVAALGGLVALAFVGTEQVAATLTLAGAVLVLGWWLVPLVGSGVDATLDPQRFATYAVPRPQLLTGLALAGVVGVPGVVTVVVALGTLVPWARGPLVVAAALVGALLGVGTCVVGARAWTTLLAPLVGSRRFREATGILLVIPLMLLGPILGAITAVLTDGWRALPRMADVAGWTPLGAAWAVPGAVAQGAWPAALGHLAIAVATLASLVALWSSALTRALESPPRVVRATARTRGLGLLGRLPATPTGAVAARCLTYWARDPRYSGALLVVPLLPLLLFFVSPDGGGLLLAVGPLTAFLLGWAISVDVAYDSTAFWLHVSSAVAGWADRAGRAAAAALIGLPTVVAVTVASVWWTDRWADLPAVLGLALGVLLTALGLSSVASARFLYPVPLPGQSPFSTPSGSAAVNLLTQLVGWTLLTALVLPELVLAFLAVQRGSTGLGVATLVTGVVLGSGMLVGGVQLGGRWFDRRTPELMQQVVSMA